MDFCLRCNAWHDGLGCPINAEIARLRAELDAAKAERDSARAALDKERASADALAETSFRCLTLIRCEYDIEDGSIGGFTTEVLSDEAYGDASGKARDAIKSHRARRAAEAKEPR